MRDSESHQTALMIASQHSEGLARVKLLLESKANAQHRMQVDNDLPMVSALELATKSLETATKLGLNPSTQNNCRSIVAVLGVAEKK